MVCLVDLETTPSDRAPSIPLFGMVGSALFLHGLFLDTHQFHDPNAIPR